MFRFANIISFIWQHTLLWFTWINKTCFGTYNIEVPIFTDVHRIIYSSETFGFQGYFTLPCCQHPEDHTLPNAGFMYDECEGMWKEDVVPYFRVISSHLFRGLGKTMKKTCWDILCPGRDSNWTPTEYKQVALPLKSTCLVTNKCVPNKTAAILSCILVCILLFWLV